MQGRSPPPSRRSCAATRPCAPASGPAPAARRCRSSPPRLLPLPIVDLGGLPPERREAEGLARLRAEARLPFGLTAAPLLRARLVRLDGECHLLSFVLHHIVSDGWSLDVLLRELAQLYTAFAERAPSPLSELPVQYADFALWQRRWLAGDGLAPQLARISHHRCGKGLAPVV